ncbi:MAG: transcriptional regulator PpsR [Rhodobacterales bacterium]|nr:transcriptional regulator PpsR [Rhodobacterales bacterium]
MTSRGAKYWNSGAIPLIAPDILGDIIADVADLAVVVSETGMVLSVLVNPVHDFFRRLEQWDGKDIRTALATESVAKFNARLAEFLAGKPDMRPVELNHSDGMGRWEFPIRYTFHRIGPDGAILMLGRDLRPVAEMQQQLVKAQMALERDYEAQREFDTRFRVLLESSREAVVFVSVQTGRITDANNVAAAILGRSRDELVGLPFAPEFEMRKRGDLLDALTAQAIADRAVPVKLQLARSGETVRLIPTLFRAAGERILLCRIEPEVTASIQADSLSQNLNGLYVLGPDAIVFTNEEGEILATNESFLNLIEMAHDMNVRGRSLSDFLSRGSVDLKVLTENAVRSGRMRLYPTKVQGEFGSPRPVEISVTSLQAGPQNVFAFLIRDAARMDQGRPSGAPMTDDNVRSVMELVGSATLKEIVAETTDVVERMCIETAIELTMNNRVAAAEMLGLSRQSLYVKLRKYGLLERGDD